MKKKKGFTLIELLAVIVILAVIALIVTPVVTGIIKSAKEQADRRSAEGYVKAGENFYASAILDSNKKVLLGTNVIESLDVSNKKATGSLIVNTDGSIDMAIIINNKCYKKSTNQTLKDIIVSDDIANCGNVIVVNNKTIGETVLSAFPLLEVDTNGCKTTDVNTYSYMGGCYLKGKPKVDAKVSAKDTLLAQLSELLTEEEKAQLLDADGNIIGAKFEEIVVPKIAQAGGVTVEQLHQMAADQGTTVFQMMNEGLTLEEVNASKSIKEQGTYLWYSGFLWRIMGINADGSIRLITEENVTSIPYNVTSATNKVNFNGSNTDKWLNDYFYNHLKNKEIIVSNNFCQGNASSTVPSKTDCTGETLLNRNIGLLSANEVALSGSKTSYLINGQDYWTLSPVSTSQVWYVNDNTSNIDALLKLDTELLLGIRPVINVKSSTYIMAGTGVMSNAWENDRFPFILNDNKNNNITGTLNEKAVSGEYVKLANKVYRVVSIDNNGNTKLILDRYYEQTEGTEYNISFGTDNIFSISSGVGQKLNGEVLNWLIPSSDTTNRNKLVSNYTWYQNEFSRGDSYTVSLNEASPLRSIQADVGLIRIGEMLSSQSYTILTENCTITSSSFTPMNYWTMNSYPNSTHAWYVGAFGNVNSAGTSYGTGPNGAGLNPETAIRPAIVVKVNTTITGGNGTPFNPYEI